MSDTEYQLLVAVNEAKQRVPATEEDIRHAINKLISQGHTAESIAELTMKPVSYVKKRIKKS